jgi:hypothetical protein
LNDSEFRCQRPTDHLRITRRGNDPPDGLVVVAARPPKRT